jgi:Ni/Fe-hydrogenase 1 B-type cytochrome subunit
MSATSDDVNTAQADQPDDLTWSKEDKIEKNPTIYVYEAPVRVWHWINALAILVLCVTGWFIGSPPPTLAAGEASENYLFGYIRFAHFTAGYVFAIGFLIRLYWAIVGNHHARQIFFIPVFKKRWWKEVFQEAAWYAFLRKDPKKYVGHNPLAQLMMFLVFVVVTIFMICTGFALYAEGTGVESWQYQMFGWVFILFGHDSQAVHTWHHFGMWVMILFVMVHVYAAIREDIMSRQSMVSTMISGHRMFKDDKP